MNGAASTNGAKLIPISTLNKSPLIKLISLPELVSVMLFIESLIVFWYRAATSTLRNLIEMVNPC